MRFMIGVLLLLLSTALCAESLQLVDKSKVSVKASSWEQKAHGGWADFPPQASLDGDLSDKSSWRAEGDGQWILYTLPMQTQLDAVALAFVKGDQRQYTVSVQGSNDGKQWTALIDKQKSSGKKKGLELFSFQASSYKLIKVIGHGNTNEQFGKWINISEIDFINSRK